MEPTGGTLGRTPIAAATALFAQSSMQTTLRDAPPDADTALLITLGVGDLIHPPRRWEASMREAVPFKRRNHDVGILQDLPGTVYLSPRFYVYVRANPSTRVHLKTAQGDIRFRVDEIPLGGSKTLLGGRVAVQHSVVPVLVGRGGERDIGERLTDNDYPSLVVARDGSLWVAWSGFREGADRVYAEQIPVEGGAPDREPHAVSRERGDVYRTAVAEDAEGNVWVVWSERVDDNWDLYARGFDGQSWSSIERLSRAPQPDMQHRLVRGPDGRLHLVWQGFREGRAAIFYRNRHAENGWSETIRVSAPDAPNCWEPTIAVDSRGKVYIGWDQYGPKGYDVWMRPVVAGRLEAPVEIAATERFEAYVSLAVDNQDRLWAAWHESGINWDKDWGYPFDITANAVGLYTSRNIRMAVYEDGRLLEPVQSLEEALPGPGPGGNFYEYPQLAVDGSNRVWAFFRHRRPAQHNVYYRTPSHHALWEIYGSFYDGRRWSPPVLVPYSTGRADMRIHLARDGEGQLAAAWPTDRRNFRDFVNLLPDVFAARLPLPETGDVRHSLKAYAPPPAAPALRAPQVPAALQPREGVGPVHIDEEGDVRRIRDYTYRVNRKSYKIYRGDMHRHTEISWDGYNDGSLLDTYRYAIDAAALDFLAVTEHNFGVMDEYDWWRSQKFVDLFRIGTRLDAEPAAFAGARPMVVDVWVLCGP